MKRNLITAILMTMVTTILLGIIYPLVGVSLLGALAIDSAWRRLSALRQPAAG